MNLFGMGTQEIVIILIAALVIFGPNRLPEIAGKLGKTVGDLKRMSSDLTGELERNKDIQDLKRTVQGEISGFKSQVSGVADTVKSAAGTTNSAAASTTSPTAAKPSTTSTISAAKPATSTTTSSSSSTSANGSKVVVASKKDPLADFATFEEVKPAPAANAAPAAAAVTAPNPAVSPKNGASTDVDALSRARQRRLAAGYNQRAT
jgi:Tat protein translocase TatB subunit